MRPSAPYATRRPSGETVTHRRRRTGNCGFVETFRGAVPAELAGDAPPALAICGDIDACISPVSTSTPNRIACAVLRVSFTWNGITATFLSPWFARPEAATTSTRRIFPPAHSTTLFESGVHAIVGYTPWTAHVSCMSRSRPSQIGRSTPDSRSFTNSVDL